MRDLSEGAGVPIPGQGGGANGIADRPSVELRGLFAEARQGGGLAAAGGIRWRERLVPGLDVVFDHFSEPGLTCAFLRFAESTQLAVAGEYRVCSCVAGGWVLRAVESGGASYWVPVPPLRRRVDDVGRILAEEGVLISGLSASAERLVFEVEQRQGWVVDLVVWQIPAGAQELVEAIDTLGVGERQPIFLWGSHTLYRRPADLYLHLIGGYVYENRTSWPHYWRICSENDAHALGVTLRGLALSTGKAVYGVLYRQILLSVVERQAEDGGWYHGEWTDGYESHFRLHTSGVHLLLDAMDAGVGEGLRAPLDAAVAFLVERADRLGPDTWFLHDSLELDERAMASSPFSWLPSRVLGKRPSNMVVLNTHLDTTIALDRYREVTGEDRYRSLVESAHRATCHLLSLRPAEWLYRPLFRIIALSLLPTTEAERLPVWTRVLKRIGWKYLSPQLWRLKARFPRLAMPGGYVDRALSLKGLAHEYQTINTMDLARYRRRLDGDTVSTLLDEALAFTRRSGLLARWRELEPKRYALGFWVETLYHCAVLDDELGLRDDLAHAMIDLDGTGLGLPPSLLGANGEAVAPEAQLPCPRLAEAALRVANLSVGSRLELLVVNPTNRSLPLAWEASPPPLEWRNGEGEGLDPREPTVGPAGWVLGRGAREGE